MEETLIACFTFPIIFDLILFSKQMKVSAQRDVCNAGRQTNAEGAAGGLWGRTSSSVATACTPHPNKLHYLMSLKSHAQKKEQAFWRGLHSNESLRIQSMSKNKRLQCQDGVKDESVAVFCLTIRSMSAWRGNSGGISPSESACSPSRLCPSPRITYDSLRTDLHLLVKRYKLKKNLESKTSCKSSLRFFCQKF